MIYLITILLIFACLAIGKNFYDKIGDEWDSVIIKILIEFFIGALIVFAIAWALITLYWISYAVLMTFGGI